MMINGNVLLLQAVAVDDEGGGECRGGGACCSSQWNLHLFVNDTMQAIQG